MTTAQHSKAAVVAVIDSNPRQRDELAKVLTSYYRVADFADVESAIGMMRQPPSVVLVDEKVRPKNRRELVRTLRGEVALQGVPIVVCKSKLRAVGPLEQYPDAEPDALLEKPFRRSDLINTVSGLINRGVEAKWEALPARARKTLGETLAVFNGIPSLVERGEPLPYPALDAACAPLIDAVVNSEYKFVLSAVRGHDNYSYVHSLRVSTLLTLFGHTIGLKDNALVLLACGGLVHDIGKTVVPHDILNKAGKLAPGEWEVMRGHVDATVRYLGQRPDMPKGVVTIAAQHHEKLDGSGYPHGLPGAKLNDLARMAAIVDIFSALTDRRSYKPPMTPEAALGLMVEEMSGQLDMRLLKMFRAMLLDAASGAWA